MTLKKPLFLLMALPLTVFLIMLGCLNAFAAQSDITVKVDKTQSCKLTVTAASTSSEKSLTLSLTDLTEGPHYLDFPKSSDYTDGYYWINADASIDTSKAFHQANVTVAGKNFKGLYYFGYKNGRLYLRSKSGTVTINKKKYYIYKTGRAITDSWKNGKYFTSTGEMAVMTQTPDGSYVDCNGDKCSQERMNLSPLRDKLKKLIKKNGGTWSVYIKNLKSGDIVSINSSKKLYPASVMKIYAMACVYNQIKSGKIKNTSTVKSYLKKMITVSDNDSFNHLVLLCGGGSWAQGCNVVNKYIKSLGITNSVLHSSMYPASMARVSDNGELNVSCAQDAALILEKIYKGQLVSKSYSKKMLKLLLGQTRTYKIPAGLPSGIKCANKTGENPPYNHDVAIVYGKKTTYEVCIFTKNGSNGQISNMSSVIYQYLN